MRNTITWPRSSFVGFDRMWSELDQCVTEGIAKSPAFPRHNIVKLGEDSYSIELAVAGYDRSDLDISVKNNQLTVTGHKNDDDKEYIHKGISAKSFTKTFTLNDNVVVESADLELNGLLVIVLTMELPEEETAKTIPIGEDS